MSSAIAADKTAFEGTVSVMVTGASTEATQLLFTRKGNQLRIEDAARNKPEPVNLVDLASGKLTIIFPHNSTFAQVAPAKTPAPPGKQPRLHRHHLRLPDREVRIQFRPTRATDPVRLNLATGDERIG